MSDGWVNPGEPTGEDRVLVPHTNRGNHSHVYHLPREGDPDTVQCYFAYQPVPYRPRSRAELEADEKPWSLCKYCDGTQADSAAENSRTGWEMRRELEKLDPEDLGLDPYPGDDGEEGEHA